MPAKRPDVDGPIVIHPVIPEVRDLVDVDQHLGRGKAKLHHRDQALTPGQDLGVTTAVLEECDRIVD
jgi:hypothetical protein